jgi:hypothetical protein
MADPFAGAVDSVIAPATKAVAVVPHDSDALGDIPKALFIGTGGHLVLRGAGGGADVTFRNIADGTVLPVRAQFVRATGTTAADIVALY